MNRVVRNTKKAVAIALAAVLMLPNVLPMPAYAAPTAVSAGEQEAAYMEWDAVNNAAGYQVYVKEAGASDASYKQIDDELIRRYEDGWRADAVGLSEGSYEMKVVPVTSDGKTISNGVIKSEVLEVSSYDRSGFAFSNSSTYKSGSGAYNDDGTLKSGAQVIYITPDSAKTVTLDVITNAKGATTTCVGISAILTARAKGYDTTPLAIRFVGKVTEADMSGQLNSSGYLQVKGKANYSEMNITLEGIGDDATAYGWGLLVRYCGNVEVRNLGFMLFPDDGISMDTGNCNIWVHNNDILYGSAGSDADQAKGDGSCDMKNDSKFLTVSYNHFWDSGKASLCGMKSESGDNYITYHHNWFDHSDSRHPRIRTMSVHVYNNYYDGNSKYGIGITSGASAFVENNYFRNCKYPMMSSLQGTDSFYGVANQVFSGEDGGMIKAYGNYIEGAKRFVDQTYSATDFDAITVSSRTQTVPSTYRTIVGGTVYNNFDTNGTVDLGVTTADIDNTMDVVEVVTALAGRMNGGDFSWTFNNAVDDASSDVNAPLMAAIKSYDNGLISVGGNGGAADDKDTPEETTTAEDNQETEEETTTTQEQPTGSSVIHNFTADGLSSSFYSITGNLSSAKGTVSYNGMTLTQCLKMESATTIKFTAAKAGVLILVFNEDFNGSTKIDGVKTTANAGIIMVDIAAGTHEILKSDTTNLYYMSLVYNQD